MDWVALGLAAVGIGLAVGRRWLPPLAAIAWLVYLAIANAAHTGPQLERRFMVWIAIITVGLVFACSTAGVLVRRVVRRLA